MSENENVSGTTGNSGHAGGAGGTGGGAGNGWGWEPVPHGGEYDNEATAFVKLPQDMLDALDNGEPLAAPGHGYVPPPMIVPLGSASADPSATGAWTMPVQWPEAPAAQAPAPSRGPIPASIPLPPSVAAAYGEPEQTAVAGGAGSAGSAGGTGGAGGVGGVGGVTDFGSTAEWQFPEAVHQQPESHGSGTAHLPDEHAATGQWTLPTGGEPLPGAGEFPGAGDYRDGEFRDGDLPGGDFRGAEFRGGEFRGGEFRDGDFRDGEGFPGGGGLGGDTFGGDGFRSDVFGGAGGAPVGGTTGAGDWSQAPATLPGGASAPWAQPGVPGGAGAGLAGSDGQMSSGVLPGEGPAAGAQGRGPRVLGGPGVGTPLPESFPQPGPEPEGVPHAAPDIDAAHGPARAPAQEPVQEQRPRPVDAGAEDGAESAGAPAEDAAAAGREPEHGHGHGFVAGGSAGVAEEADPVAEAGAAPVPGEDTADSAVTPPDEGGAEGFPVQEATYEEEGIPAVAHHEHPSASYVLRVNGADRPVTGAWIGESLLYVLRERLGLAGAKDGCSQGECGACAVQVDGRLVASCLVPAATAAGSEVRTVEGLATDGELSDVQEALCRSGGVQCGFCVPGMAMTIHDLLEGNHAPSDLETRQALCGNLCRCSGYKGVIEAVREVVAEREATAAGETAPAATGTGAPEPRIPHQAPPGEGSVHGGQGGHGSHDAFGGQGFQNGHDTFGGQGLDVLNGQQQHGHDGPHGNDDQYQANYGHDGHDGNHHNGGMA
ncbi:2Fe-2S iron-sulfur cluster-binding protein [Streptomyces sp. NPDC002033]|uniref:2Fe-2S iron-sulfur cluster-binding protein n=1 Tax=unclassified Streptomyces TaxID=2593676 RepID=UPI003320050D